MKKVLDDEAIGLECSDLDGGSSSEKPSLTKGDKGRQQYDYMKVKEMEIIKDVCSGNLARVFLLASAFLCGFAYYLDMVTRSVYTTYAANSYEKHSLLSTIQVINSVVGVGAQISFARLSDVFGRLQMFVVGTILYVVGTIIQSQAHDVKVYAVGAIFYNTGFVGVSLLLILVLSDMSPLRWRLFYQFTASFPCIIISWISGDIVEAANPMKNWSWDIGMWAFIFPLSSLPFITYLFYATHISSKTKKWKDLRNKVETHKRNIILVVKDIFNQIDIVGTVLVTAALGLILVPLTLAGGVSERWHEPGIIATLVIGIALLLVFLFWEAKFAKNAALPFNLLKDRGVWASIVAAFLEKMIYAMISDYLYPVLLVSVNETNKSATRIVWLPTFMACLCSVFFGLLVVSVQRLKVFTICGTFLWIISIGLFYQFRGGESSHSGIIGASIVLGFGSAIFTQSIIVTLQAMASHDNMASITGLYFMFAQVGAATGASISGAIWTQTMYKQLLKQLKDSDLTMAVFASPYEFIASYAWGTKERDLVIQAYRHVQKVTMLVSLILTVPLLVSVLFTKDRKLSDSVSSDASHEDDDPMYTWVCLKARAIKKRLLMFR